MRKQKFNGVIRGVGRSAGRQMEKDNKITFLISIILTFLAFLSTQSHEQFHVLVASIFGWTSTTQALILTGSTDVVSQTAVTLPQIWIFYMFAPIFTYLFMVWITISYPSRFIGAMGIVVLGLNIASFAPEIIKSDAYNAMQFAISSGMDTSFAYITHWMIFLMALAVYIVYIYIVVDNNSSDMKRRLKIIL